MPARDFIDLVLRSRDASRTSACCRCCTCGPARRCTTTPRPAWREQGARLLAEGALRELRQSRAGSQHQLTWARFFATPATRSADLQLLRGLLEGSAKIDGLDVDQELRWAFVEPLASHGGGRTRPSSRRNSPATTPPRAAPPGPLPGGAPVGGGQGPGVGAGRRVGLAVQRAGGGDDFGLRAGGAAGAAGAVRAEVLRGDRARVGRSGRSRSAWTW